MTTARAICLIIAVWLLTACGSTQPTPSPTVTSAPSPTPLPTSLPTNTPIPLPTKTPIPGYVGGEEGPAYASFVAYYQNEVFDCYFGPSWPNMETMVDEKYLGKAIYVGDGIWRFYVQIIFYDSDNPEETRSYKEEVRQVSSLSDQTWANICTPEWEEYNEQPEQPEPDYPVYEPYYPDETDRPIPEPDYPDQPDEEPQEQPEPSW